MKIAPLLAQYLYTNGKLDLQGIGTFTLDNPSALTLADNKNKPLLLEGVNFQQNKNTGEDAELISYISSQTGKIIPLASSDLESHLELAKQFLNIGKPFLFEGIGTLSKKGNEYNFSSGTMIAEPVKEPIIREAIHQQAADESGSYSDVFFAKKNAAKNAWKKPTIFALVIVGIGLAVWGGYVMYKKTSNSSDVQETANTAAEKDSTENKNIEASNNGLDTTSNKTTNTVVASENISDGNYKFVIEKADSLRAAKRYQNLKNFGLDIRMERADSTHYKLFFVLPATIADTARLADSIRKIRYSPAGQTVSVEK